MIKIKFSNSLYMVWDADDVITLRKTYRIVGNLIGTLPEHPRQNDSNGLPLILMSEEVRLLQSLNIVEIVEQTLNLEDSRLIEMEQDLEKKFIEDIQNKNQQERKKQILVNLDKIVQGKLKKSKLALKPTELEAYRKNTLHELISQLSNQMGDGAIIQNRNRFYIKSPYNSFKIEKSIQMDRLEPFSLESLKYLTFKHFWSNGYYLTSGLKYGAHYLAYDHDPLMFHAKFIIICCTTDQHFQHCRTQMTQVYGRLGKNVRKNVIVAHYKPDCSEESIQLEHIQWNPKLFTSTGN